MNNTPTARAALRVRLTVEDAIRGIDRKTVTAVTEADTAACGIPFHNGVSYLVYASRSGEDLAVSLCSRTGRAENRRDDLALLKEARAARVRPRLLGDVDRMQLRLDGFYMHFESVGGLAGIKILA